MVVVYMGSVLFPFYFKGQPNIAVVEFLINIFALV